MQRKLRDEAVPRVGAEVVRLARALFALALGLALLQVAKPVLEGRLPFLIEHAIRAVCVFLFVYAGFAGVSACWRLAGFPGRVCTYNFFAARTPADFWRRYNRHSGQFFQCDVFEPWRRRLGEFGSVVATFAINGLGHEYIATIALGRLQGYQTAFFLIQGLAVAFTLRIKPRGPWVPLAVALTFAFNVISSLLFFASGNQLVGWYSNNAPAWFQPR